MSNDEAVNVVITRPEEAASRFVASWVQSDHSALVNFIFAPMLVFDPYPLTAFNDSIDNQQYQGLVFTSQYAVEAFAPYFNAYKDFSRSIKHIFCVGRETERCVSSLFLLDDQNVHVADGNVETLASIVDKMATDEGAAFKLLFPGGRHLAKSARQMIEDAPADIRPLTIYDMVLSEDLGAAKPLVSSPAREVYTFFSPRSARHFADLVANEEAEEAMAAAACVCLSDNILQSVEHLPWRVSEVAATTQRQSMLQALENACVRLS